MFTHTYIHTHTRLQLRKNNIESKDDMKFYETVQLVIQTLDMRLEQQTVVASWALIKSWMELSGQSVGADADNEYANYDLSDNPSSGDLSAGECKI